jgi:hypothetical protein
MELWDEIKELEGKVLETLRDKKKFEVVEVRDAVVIIKILGRGHKKWIPWKYIEGAYCELAALGKISRNGIMARHAPWFPAHVAAILANLPDVTYTIRSIVLYYKKNELPAKDFQPNLLGFLAPS